MSEKKKEKDKLRDVTLLHIFATSFEYEKFNWNFLKYVIHYGREGVFCLSQLKSEKENIKFHFSIIF